MIYKIMFYFSIIFVQIIISAGFFCKMKFQQGFFTIRGRRVGVQSQRILLHHHLAPVLIANSWEDGGIGYFFQLGKNNIFLVTSWVGIPKRRKHIWMVLSQIYFFLGGFSSAFFFDPDACFYPFRLFSLLFAARICSLFNFF